MYVIAKTLHADSNRYKSNPILKEVANTIPDKKVANNNVLTIFKTPPHYQLEIMSLVKTKMTSIRGHFNK